MPRPHRVQFPGAIYHLISQVDGRRALFHDEGHYQRFTCGFNAQFSRLSRCGWEHRVTASDYAAFRSSAPGRDMAAVPDEPPSSICIESFLVSGFGMV